MTSSLLDGYHFLITTVFNLFLFILIARCILAYRRSNYANPLTQFVVRMTRFCVQPLKKILPDFRGIECATLTLVFLLQCIKWFLLIIPFAMPNPLGLLMLALVDSLKLTLEVFFYAILIQAILTWIQPGSPMSFALYDLCAPVIKPFQRLIPPIGGFDLSPIPALIVLQLLIMIVITPLLIVGTGIAIG